MNNHEVVFSVLNCHIPWKSDEFPDFHNLDTDQLLIVISAREAKLKTHWYPATWGRCIKAGQSERHRC